MIGKKDLKSILDNWDVKTSNLSNEHREKLFYELSNIHMTCTDSFVFESCKVMKENLSLYGEKVNNAAEDVMKVKRKIEIIELDIKGKEIDLSAYDERVCELSRHIRQLSQVSENSTFFYRLKKRMTKSGDRSEKEDPKHLEDKMIAINKEGMMIRLEVGNERKRIESLKLNLKTAGNKLDQVTEEYQSYLKLAAAFERVERLLNKDGFTVEYLFTLFK